MGLFLCLSCSAPGAAEPDASTSDTELQSTTCKPSAGTLTLGSNTPESDNAAKFTAAAEGAEVRFILNMQFSYMLVGAITTHQLPGCDRLDSVRLHVTEDASGEAVCETTLKNRALKAGPDGATLAPNLYCLANTDPEWEATDGTFKVTLKTKNEELTTELKIHLIHDDTLPWEQCDVGAEPVFGDQPSIAAHQGGAFSTIEAQLKANPGFSGGWSVDLDRDAKGWGLPYYRTHVLDGAKVAAGLGETVALEPTTAARPARIELKGGLAVWDRRPVEILLGIEHDDLTLTEATLQTVFRAGD